MVRHPASAGNRHESMDSATTPDLTLDLHAGKIAEIYPLAVGSTPGRAPLLEKGKHGTDRFRHWRASTPGRACVCAT